MAVEEGSTSPGVMEWPRPNRSKLPLDRGKKERRRRRRRSTKRQREMKRGRRRGPFLPFLGTSSSSSPAFSSLDPASLLSFLGSRRRCLHSLTLSLSLRLSFLLLSLLLSPPAPQKSPATFTKRISGVRRGDGRSEPAEGKRIANSLEECGRREGPSTSLSLSLTQQRVTFFPLPLCASFPLSPDVVDLRGRSQGSSDRAISFWCGGEGRGWGRKKQYEEGH